ncbi:MAG: DNA damage-inducible protein D [Syntrophomonas sp.]|nr:DNA damage-inducible protein D [Proteiniphilum sp.]MDD3878981.1 DNA damage-inducible protein D [Syntrophomonas sp.]
MPDKPVGSQSPFEQIKRINEQESEYWSARDLMKILGYLNYRNFLPVIKKAIRACENSDISASDHFAQVRNMIETGKGAKRSVNDYYLSRYACYLVVQNADSEKEMVALGQTYFAVQTRKQEIFEQASENEKRVILWQEMRIHNKHLSATAQEAGVETSLDFAIFQNHGYKGLYGGLDAQGIKKRKGLSKSQDILDHMGSTELAANLFRATQTDEKIKREKIQGKFQANKAHFEVGHKVRRTIQELGGTMPEELPTADSIKKLEREKQKALKEKMND